MGIETRAERESSGLDVRVQSTRRTWLVGLALLGVVAAVLVGAFALNDRFRPRVEDGPATGTAVAGSSGVSATVAPGRPADQPSPAPATVVSTPGEALASPSGPRVANSPLEKEIEDAYYRYWEVRSSAYLNLDSSRLSEVLAEPKLAREEKQIRDLQAQGRAAKLDVVHLIAFVSVSQDRAVLYDEYLNKSVFIDPVTKKELTTASPPVTEKVSVEMRKMDGAWKVVDGTQHE